MSTLISQYTLIKNYPATSFSPFFFASSHTTLAMSQNLKHLALCNFNSIRIYFKHSCITDWIQTMETIRSTNMTVSIIIGILLSLDYDIWGGLESGHHHIPKYIIQIHILTRFFILLSNSPENKFLNMTSHGSCNISQKPPQNRQVDQVHEPIQSTNLLLMDRL